MNVLAERMKALKAKEASENAAVVDAAIERDQAIVAGIRGDAADVNWFIYFVLDRT